MNLITAAEFERRMKEIAETKLVIGSIESGVELATSKHRDADYLMCEALKSVGYDAGVEIYERMTKWYG